MDNPAVKYGLYYGVFFVFYNSILKFMAPKMIFSGSLTIALSFIIPIACMVFATREIKSFQDNFLSYGEAIKNTFLVYAIGSLISIFYQFILINFIDPSLLDVQSEVIMETGSWIADLVGSEEVADQMEEQMEIAAEEARHQSFGQTFVGWLVNLILGFIIAAIVSAFVKKTN